MKKNVLTILGVVGVIGFFALVFMPREKLKEMNIPFVNNEKGDSEGIYRNKKRNIRKLY